MREKRIKCAGSRVYKDSDYRRMKIVWFDKLLWVYPMGTVPGAVSNDDIAYPKYVNNRTKQRWSLTSGFHVGKIHISLLYPIITMNASLGQAQINSAYRGGGGANIYFSVK